MVDGVLLDGVRLIAKFLEQRHGRDRVAAHLDQPSGGCVDRLL